MEDKQIICNHLCASLQATRNAGGDGNSLVQLIYEETDSGDEFVIPVFKKSGRWGKINVTADSGTAMISDIVDQFVRKAW